MPALEGRCDLATGAGSREEARGGRTGREGAERGADGTVDGNPEGARVGKKGQMPHCTMGQAMEIDILEVCKRKKLLHAHF